MTDFKPDELQPGDPVARFTQRSFQGQVSLTTVERLTATQIVTADGYRYRRNSGREVGDHYGAQLLPVDDSRVADAQARQAVRDLRYRMDKHLGAFAGDAASAVVALDEAENLIRLARQRMSASTAPRRAERCPAR